jgi:hypothetical protein
LEVDMWRFMVIMAPMTLVAVLAGAIFILRPLRNMSTHHDGRISLPEMKGFFWEIMPILVIVFVIMALAGLTNLMNFVGFSIRIPGAISILPGLMVSVIWVCIVNHISLAQLRSAVLAKSSIPMLFLVASIMIFKGIMVDSQAVSQIRNELMAYGIPIALIVAVIPFISGFINGLAVGFVGISFPLIIPLFQTANPFEYLSLAALAYTFGYMGQILSPIHLCFLVTKDYFKAGLLGSYRYIVMPSLAVMTGAILIFLISRSI